MKQYCAYAIYKYLQMLILYTLFLNTGGGRSVQIQHTDMPTVMQQTITDLADQALDKHTDKDSTASSIMADFNNQQMNWYCIVGPKGNLGLDVEAETGKFIYFYIGNVGILVFKAG